MTPEIFELGEFLGWPRSAYKGGAVPLVVTCKGGVEGAMALFMDGVLEECCVRLECEKLFLLPCSIHEWIVLPYVGGRAEDVARIVRDTNKNVVGPRDYMTNRLFSWDRWTGLQEEEAENFAPLDDELHVRITRREDDLELHMEGDELCLD